jgi:hypothetical protein
MTSQQNSESALQYTKFNQACTLGAAEVASGPIGRWRIRHTLPKCVVRGWMNHPTLLANLGDQAINPNSFVGYDEAQYHRAASDIAGFRRPQIALHGATQCTTQDCYAGHVCMNTSCNRPPITGYNGNASLAYPVITIDHINEVTIATITNNNMSIDFGVNASYGETIWYIQPKWDSGRVVMSDRGVPTSVKGICYDSLSQFLAALVTFDINNILYVESIPHTTQNDNGFNASKAVVATDCAGRHVICFNNGKRTNASITVHIDDLIAISEYVHGFTRNINANFLSTYMLGEIPPWAREWYRLAPLMQRLTPLLCRIMPHLFHGSGMVPVISEIALGYLCVNRPTVPLNPQGYLIDAPKTRNRRCVTVGPLSESPLSVLLTGWEVGATKMDISLILHRITEFAFHAS